MLLSREDTGRPLSLFVFVECLRACACACVMSVVSFVCCACYKERRGDGKGGLREGEWFSYCRSLLTGPGPVIQYEFEEGGL